MCSLLAYSPRYQLMSTLGASVRYFFKPASILFLTTGLNYHIRERLSSKKALNFVPLRLSCSWIARFSGGCWKKRYGRNSRVRGPWPRDRGPSVKLSGLNKAVEAAAGTANNAKNFKSKKRSLRRRRQLPSCHGNYRYQDYHYREVRYDVEYPVFCLLHLSSSFFIYRRQFTVKLRRLPQPESP